MAMSEELQRRINNLTGDAEVTKPMMMAASGEMPPYANMSLPDSLQNRQSNLGFYQNMDIKEMLSDYASQLSAGYDVEGFMPALEELTGLSRNNPEFQNMMQMAAIDVTRKDTSIPEVVAYGSVEDSPETVAQRAQDQELRAYQERVRTAPSMAPINPMRDQMEAVAPNMGTDQKMIELQEAIRELQQQKSMTDDPEEIEALDRMIETATTKALAPQAELIEELSQTAGEDNMMAHVRSGDLNISREMLENNPQLEDAIERAALEKA